MLWWKVATARPRCQPVDCGAPAPAPMVIIDPYVNITVGSLITYHCDNGLIVNNTIISICQSDGQWSPSPDRHTCRSSSAAVCGDPAPPPHGSIGLYNSTVEGTILIFKCDEGYTPTGEMTTTCTADGNWEPNPECVMREASGRKHPLPYEAAVCLASVICFISGGVLGMLCLYVILRCKQSHAAKNGQHVVSQPPIPVYEDIHTTSCDKPTIELSENVAYGHIDVDNAD